MNEHHSTIWFIVKKVQTSEFANAKTRGIIGLKLKDGDKLISAIPTDAKSEVLLVTRRGKALRFSENTVREMGRASFVLTKTSRKRLPTSRIS